MHQEHTNHHYNAPHPEHEPAKKHFVASPLLIALLSILGIIIFLGVVGGLMVPLSSGPHESKVNDTKVSLNNIQQALLTFQIDCERLPTNEEGLDALVNAPVPCPRAWHATMDKLPKDGWGNSFVYTAPASGKAVFDLYSIGPDGIDGTQDDIHLSDLN